jgi:hypothetical protein
VDYHTIDYQQEYVVRAQKALIASKKASLYCGLKNPEKIQNPEKIREDACDRPSSLQEV